MKMRHLVKILLFWIFLTNETIDFDNISYLKEYKTVIRQIENLTRDEIFERNEIFESLAKMGISCLFNLNEDQCKFNPA